MKFEIGLLLILVASQSVLCWFGSEAETTTAAPSTTEQPSTTTTDSTTTVSEVGEELKKISDEAPEVPADEATEQLEQPDGENFEGENPLDGIDFYMYTVKDMAGNDFSLEAYRGYVTLVVNVASKCGYTESTYKDLVALQNKFEPTGIFTVLAFPCNQFWEQEPDTHEDIMRFVTDKYGVNFPMFAKTDVSGDNATDVWHYLAQATGYAPQWNFWKYLVDQNGHVVDVWSHETAAIELEGWIEDAISKAIAQAEGSYNGEGFADYDAGAENETVHHEHGDEL